MKFNNFSHYGLSIGADSVPELWDPETLDLPAHIEMLTDTDLYELCDHKVIACDFSPKHMVILTLQGHLLIFD